MSDETKPNGENGNGWKMPEPVFRSSEGRKPGELPPDPQGDIPTEPGFTEDDPEPQAPEARQSVRAKADDRTERHVKKKRGCARTFVMIVGTVTILALSIIVGLIYFLFFYRPVDTTTF